MTEIPIRQLAKIIAGAIIAVLIFLIIALATQPILDIILDSKAISSLTLFISMGKQAVERGSASNYYITLEGPRTNNVFVVGTFCNASYYQKYVEDWHNQGVLKNYDRAKSMCREGYCFCILKVYTKNEIQWDEVKPFVLGDDYDEGLLDEIDKMQKRGIKVLSCMGWPADESGSPYKVAINVPRRCWDETRANWLLCFVNIIHCVLTTETEEVCSQSAVQHPFVGIMPYTTKEVSFITQVLPVEIQDVYVEKGDRVYYETVPTFPTMNESKFGGIA